MPYPPRMLTHAGQTLSLDKWADLRGLAVETIRCRLDRLQWPVERALDTPADRRFRRGGRPRSDVPRAVPNLRHDKPTGRAFSRWRAFGRDNVLYFGPWGSSEATASYRRFVSEWAAGRYEAVAATEADGLFTADLILRWLARCQKEYQKGGKATSELHCHRAAMLPLTGCRPGEACSIRRRGWPRLRRFEGEAERAGRIGWSSLVDSTCAGSDLREVYTSGRDRGSGMILAKLPRGAARCGAIGSLTCLWEADRFGDVTNGTLCANQLRLPPLLPTPRHSHTKGRRGS